MVQTTVNTNTRKRTMKGWSKQAPNSRQRTVMMRKCGKKCFLGLEKSFPICVKNTCKISKKGVLSAYTRARQYRAKGSQYYKVARKALNTLRKMKWYQRNYKILWNII